MRFAHRFFVLWGSIAALCFAVSGVLTWIVVRVYAPAGPKFIGISGDRRLASATATIDYYATTRPVWIVTFPEGADDVLLPGGPAADCEDARNTFINGPLGTLDRVENGRLPRLNKHLVRHVQESPSFDVYQINVKHAQSRRLGGRIACLINVLPDRESLTDWSLGLNYLRMTGPELVEPRAIRISVTIPGAEGMQVYGGSSSSAGGTYLTPGTQALFRYSNVQQEGTRDILFILIGTFVALGAATTLEAIRPYIERLAGRR
jgi:hypothetical protein